MKGHFTVSSSGWVKVRGWLSTQRKFRFFPPLIKYIVCFSLSECKYWNPPTHTWENTSRDYRTWEVWVCLRVGRELGLCMCTDGLTLYKSLWADRQRAPVVDFLSSRLQLCNSHQELTLWCVLIIYSYLYGYTQLSFNKCNSCYINFL